MITIGNDSNVMYNVQSSVGLDESITDMMMAQVNAKSARHKLMADQSDDYMNTTDANTTIQMSVQKSYH
jgi:hypothetical protein